MSAYNITTKPWTGGGDWVSIRGECTICGHETHIGARTNYVAVTALRLEREHLDQHRPGRALDITVDWDPRAWCSVCPDGGDINTSGDGLECRDCGTTWDLEGTNGELSEVTE